MSSLTDEGVVALAPVQTILSHEIDGHHIGQRQTDRYVNATALCKAGGKLFADYRRLNSTAEFLAELASVMGNPITELVEVRQGGTPSDQGTWVHPRVATHLAQWISPRFSVIVSGWLDELLTTGRVELAPNSGDPLLNTILAVAEVRQRQLAQDKAIASVRSTAEAAMLNADAATAVAGEAKDKATAAESLAEEAVARSTAALRSVVTVQDNMSVAEFTGRKRRGLTAEELSAFGKYMTRFCDKRGIAIQKTQDPEWGEVNAYPVGVLEDQYDTWFNAVNR